MEEACAEIALRTRQFARRQRTWFRKFPVHWVDPRAEGVAKVPGDISLSGRWLIHRAIAQSR